MGHPVGNVHVDAVDSCRGNLAHSLHVDSPPLGRKRADPDIFVAFFDPECRAPAEERFLSRDFLLQPVGMIFGHRMRRLIGVGGNALRTRDVHKSVIAGFVSSLGNGLNSLQFLCWIKEAFVATGNVVIDFDPGDVVGFGVADDLCGVSSVQRISGDANVVRPILSGGKIVTSERNHACAQSDDADDLQS